MAGYERPELEPGEIPEARSVEVADVNQDAELCASRHEPATGGGEARTDVRRGRRHERDPVAERVRPAPHGAERAQPGGVPQLQRLERRIDRLGALEVQDRSRRA